MYLDSSDVCVCLCFYPHSMPSPKILFEGFSLHCTRIQVSLDGQLRTAFVEYGVHIQCARFGYFLVIFILIAWEIFCHT